MKEIFFSITLLCILYTNNVAQYITTCNYKTVMPTEDGTCIPGEWTLVFEDEFEGNQINKNKWSTYFGYGDRCHGDEPQVYLDDNVFLNNGILTLLFKEQPDNYDMCGGTTKWKKYSSGMIYSKKSFLYGIFEAEIKIPSGTGYWPAFWLWGSGGEIDIFEFYDDETSPEFSNHNYIDPDHPRCTESYNGIDYSADYHIYTVYWDPKYIAFFIDNDLKYIHWLFYDITSKNGITCNKLKSFHEYIISKSFPSHYDEEHVIINLAGQKNRDPTPLNRELKVKNVRVWQKIENICTDKTISQINSNNIVGKSLIVDGNITIKSGQNITLTAQNNIHLKPGLHIEKGANFRADIDPNLCFDSNIRLAKEYTLPQIDFSKIDSIINISTEIFLQDKKNITLIYPNIFKDKIRLLSNKPGELLIIDISGRILFSSSFKSEMNQFDLSSFNNGFYFAKIISGERFYIEKIIKQ